MLSWFIFPGNLLLYEGKGNISGFGVERPSGRRTWRSGGRGVWGQGLLYERRINSRNIKNTHKQVDFAHLYHSCHVKLPYSFRFPNSKCNTSPVERGTFFWIILIQVQNTQTFINILYWILLPKFQEHGITVCFVSFPKMKKCYNHICVHFNTREIGLNHLNLLSNVAL